MKQNWNEFGAVIFSWSPDSLIFVGDLKNSDLFQYGNETMHAWKEGRLSDDITTEQRKVEEAELVIFQVRLLFCSPVDKDDQGGYH